MVLWGFFYYHKAVNFTVDLSLWKRPRPQIKLIYYKHSYLLYYARDEKKEDNRHDI